MTSPPVGVLVVDDQPAFRDAARAVIDRVGAPFTVIAEAESGEAAVSMIPELGPGLVLMDINMGAMSGIEAARIIKADHPEVMIVLLSTYQVEDLPSDVRSSGASAYIHKEDFSGRVLKRLWADGGDPTFTT